MNAKNFIYGIKSFPKLLNDYYRLKKQLKKSKSWTDISLSYPNLVDHLDSSGVASGHYFHQDYYVAKKIFENSPKTHVDIASRVDGFVAHVAVFREIEVFDIRPLESSVENIKFRQVDIMTKNPSLNEYCDSLSCLHALEHFGLGRYGDKVDSDGHIAGIENIKKILRKNGTLYLSVPIGPERIEFNAHRIFNTKTIVKLLQPEFLLEDFSYIDDIGDFHEGVERQDKAFSDSMNCFYGCGLFTFRKTV